jgi:hypothetical protein
VGRDFAHYIALNFKHENGNFFYYYGSEGRGIFTIGKYGVKFKILKCSKQTLSPFPQQSTLARRASSKCIFSVQFQKVAWYRLICSSMRWHGSRANVGALPTYYSASAILKNDNLNRPGRWESYLKRCLVPDNLINSLVAPIRSAFSRKKSQKKIPKIFF